MDELQRLGDRLDVIETALSVALTEPEPEHRGRLLDTLNAATEVARAEHGQAESNQQNRSSIRLVHSAIPHPADRPPTETDAPAARSTYRTLDHARSSAG